MKVHIDKIGDEGLTLDESLSLEWLTNALGENSAFQPTQPGHYNVLLSRAEEVVHTHGRCSITVQTPCVRCLETFIIPLKAPISTTVFPRNHKATEEEKEELSEEDLGISIYDNREIDLSPILHDAIYLELPMNPVCKADCLGICSRCGTNLNNDTCACTHESKPNAFGVLKQLKL